MKHLLYSMYDTSWVLYYPGSTILTVNLGGIETLKTILLPTSEKDVVQVEPCSHMFALYIVQSIIDMHSAVFVLFLMYFLRLPFSPVRHDSH